jgi:hypothetical protein
MTEIFVSLVQKLTWALAHEIKFLLLGAEQHNEYFDDIARGDDPEK